jgi:hypothetical protein
MIESTDSGKWDGFTDVIPHPLGWSQADFNGENRISASPSEADISLSRDVIRSAMGRPLADAWLSETRSLVNA